MFNLFKPKIYNSGWLPEKDGHKVYFMEAGNPKGKPVLVFHGGPGGAAKLRHAYAFDRKKYRVILFDQRGSGHSLPAGETLHNTTKDLLDDADRLLEYLKIGGQVIVRGGSWGSTLALLFALRHPDKVEKLLLSQIFLADEKAKRWLDEDSGMFYPDMLEKLKEENQKGRTTAQSYNAMIASEDLTKQVKAVSLYGKYERVLGSLKPRLEIEEVTADDIASNRIYIHYAAEDFMLSDGQIMENIEVIKNIPTLIVHNRLDMVCPLCGAYALHKQLPKSKLVIVPDIGHSSPMLHKAIEREIKAFLLQ